MDPIGGPNGIVPPGTNTPRRRAAASGFTVPAGRIAATAAAAPLDGLLALQECAAEPLADREARRGAQALLAELAALQRDLLADAVRGERLGRLARLADGIPDAAQPGLREAVAAVVLRARIELARFGGT